MANQSTNQSTPLNYQTQLPLDGFIAGTLGSVILVVWFLILDLVNGTPLYTAAALAHVFYKMDASPTSDLYTRLRVFGASLYVNWLLFFILGSVVSWLLGTAERHPNLGFGILLFFIVFGFGILGVTALVASEVLHLHSGLSVLIGSLLAFLGMGGYFWLRHPHMRIEP